MDRFSGKKDNTLLLGVAFLIQAVASLTSGLFLKESQKEAGILMEMIAVMGIVMLGTLLYTELKRTNRKIAITAMGLYLVEAAVLAVSQIPECLLVKMGQSDSALQGNNYLHFSSEIMRAAYSAGYDLHMLLFATGAVMFYSLILKSRSLPAIIAVIGIVSAGAALAGTVLTLLGINAPLIVFLPNLPFELTAGVLFIVKGREKPVERR